jgi:dUTP pyrophosphatase
MEIGTKVLGFMPKNCDLDYPKQFVGKVGFIDAVLENSVRVNFGNKDSWWYNADEIYENMVSDECGLGDLVVKVKKLHPDSVISQYAKPGDAGLDLTAVSEEWNEGNTMVTYGTGLAFEIPEGYVGMLFPRSSVCKTSLNLSNSVGILDSSYRGEVMLKYRYPEEGLVYDLGDRVGQLIIMPYPKVKLIEVADLSETERGEGSYGSTGK